MQRGQKKYRQQERVRGRHLYIAKREKVIIYGGGGYGFRTDVDPVIWKLLTPGQIFQYASVLYYLINLTSSFPNLLMLPGGDSFDHKTSSRPWRKLWSLLKRKSPFHFPHSLQLAIKYFAYLWSISFLLIPHLLHFWGGEFLSGRGWSVEDLKDSIVGPISNFNFFFLCCRRSRVTPTESAAQPTPTPTISWQQGSTLLTPHTHCCLFPTKLLGQFTPKK